MAAALQLADGEDPEDFPGQRMLERVSAAELERWQARFPVPPATDEFSSMWSAQEHRWKQAERARRRGVIVDVDEDEPGPSRQPRRGCSSYLPEAKDEPPSDDDEDA